MRRRAFTLCFATLLITGAAACGNDQGSGTVEITVMGQPAATDTAGRKWFAGKIAEFEAANPGIKVTPGATAWDPRTFPARLDAGNVETVILVPLTEPAGLIARGQVLDITAEAKALPTWSSYDPKVLEPAVRDDKVYGIPGDLYALGIIYNRDLFTRAGLDPDKPPVTWDELRAAAKQITERTGAIGFGAMTTNKAGGWHLTAATYSYGGTMERPGADSKATVAFTEGPTQQFLELLKQMRWTDNSMGTSQLRTQDDMNRDFAAGKVAMAINVPGYFEGYVQGLGGDPQKFGMAALPQHGGNATLVGGAVHMVTAKATDAQRAAAVKWLDHLYVSVASDPAAAAEYARSRAADGAAVGIPTLPLFDQATQDKVNAAIAPHVNVPLANFQPFVDGIGKLRYVAEPAVAAQDLYGVLDATVQAVLTKQDTDPRAALAEAADRVNTILQQKQR